MNAPTSSCSAPPAVEPVVLDGIRYMQDMSGPKVEGAAPGGRLEAVDATTGAPLWHLQVYKVIDDTPPSLTHPGRYFRSLRADTARGVLLIEDEAGLTYEVDLKSRAAKQLGAAEGDKRPTVQAKPTPR